MEFIKVLVEVPEERNENVIDEVNDFIRKNHDARFRSFKTIRLQPDLWLSIQASCMHFNKPRKTLEDLNEYTHWEVSLFNDRKYLKVTDVLPDFRSLAEIELYNKGVETLNLYANIPTDLVEELYIDLKKSCRLQTNKM